MEYYLRGVHNLIMENIWCAFIIQRNVRGTMFVIFL